MITASAVYNLGDVPEQLAGGKSHGLAELEKAGLPVPRGFVIVNPHQGIPDAFAGALASLGSGAVAVRSSALNEDGEDLSCAGQYRTILNVTGYESVRVAVLTCVNSMKESRVAEYRRGLMDSGETRMAVIVQEMIDPKCAGVLFTADPVTGANDVIIVEAVSGIGESLVDGSAMPTRYEICKSTGSIRNPAGETFAALSETILRLMTNQALKMEERAGRPLDLEWAVDRRGKLFWLQMRPITTLDGPDINELDYKPGRGELFTRANIGEMLPGAVTPLTLTVFGEAIDFSIRHFYRSVGALYRETKKGRFVCSFSNHLFLNLNMMFTIAGRVLGSSKESIEQNLLGRLIDDAPDVLRAAFPVRLANAVRLSWYLLKGNPYGKKLEKVSRSFDLDLSADHPAALYKIIDKSLPVLNWGYAWHLCISAKSGIMNTVLLEVLRKGGCEAKKLDSLLAGLLTDIEDLESADVIKHLEKMAEEMKVQGNAAQFFGSLTPADALAWIKSDRSGEHGVSFAGLLKRHGHRCIREAEFREKGWNEDPQNLIITLQNILCRDPSPSPQKRDIRDVAEDLLSEYPRVSRRAFLWALKQSRHGVWQREHAKSLVIKIQNKIKYAYGRLAHLMTERGYLPDEDVIFFLTHKEIGLVLETGDGGPVRRAVRRRRLLPAQMRLTFPDVFKGAPEPVNTAASGGEVGMLLRGTPVSAGIIRGIVRVVRSREDATRLVPGEIMAASFTDIGWTPFYGVAGGLVTEVGSSLSHGAVVAREYGLPMVTGVPNLFQILSSGDMVEIDGGIGTIQILEKNRSP